MAWTGRVCGSTNKRGRKVYNIQANTLKEYVGDVRIDDEATDDEIAASIGDVIRFTYNNEERIGSVVKVVEERQLLHVDVAQFSRPCIIGWEDVIEVERLSEEGDDTPDELIEFEGDWISKEEFDILLSDHTCCQCGMELEFVSGHVAVPMSDEVICADCNEVNMSHFEYGRRAAR